MQNELAGGVDSADPSGAGGIPHLFICVILCVNSTFARRFAQNSPALSSQQRPESEGPLTRSGYNTLIRVALWLRRAF